MALTNAERQRKYRENKLTASGNHFRLQLIVDAKTHAELERLILRLQTTKQDVVSDAIHKYAVELGCEIQEWEKTDY
ncbi:MAG: hypothetical protein IPN87_18810 [Saprospiraceae bacterium]|nr:hypothetical protein [Candidatus Brachybacter algidus]